MSLLGVDYGSDSEEDRPFAPPAPRPDPPVSPATTLSVSGTTAGNAPGSDSISTADSGQGEKHRRKKRKVKVAVSILPSHIQAALMRAAPLRRSTGQKEGPVTGVSDDEDDENDYADEMERKELDEEELERRRRIREQVAESKAVAKRQAAGATGLFALLPKPKVEKAMEKALKKSGDSAAEKKKDKGANMEADAVAVMGAASDKKEEEGDQGASSESDGAEEEKEEEEEEEEKKEEGLGLLHSSLMAGATAAALPRVSISQGMRGLAIPAPTAPAAAVGAEIRQPSTSLSVAASSELPASGSTGTMGHGAATSGLGESVGSREPQAYASYGGLWQGQENERAMRAHRAELDAYYAAEASRQPPLQMSPGSCLQPHAQEDDFEVPLSEQGSRRQKQRLQRELAAGNLSAVSKLGGQVVEVARREESWDPYRYGPPKKKEKVSIAATFYDTKTGETVTTTEASRTHKRRHQINTLAIQAAEREADLLEGKARSMQSKAQTQGKYGW